MEEFKYLETTLTNQNSIQEEIKSRLKSGNSCHHSVQNFCLPVCYEKEDIQNYNFAVVLYGCKTWSLILREECRLRVFEKRVLRRIFGPKRNKVKGEWRKLHNEEVNDLCSLTNLFEQ